MARKVRRERPVVRARAQGSRSMGRRALDRRCGGASRRRKERKVVGRPTMARRERAGASRRQGAGGREAQA